MKSAPPIRIEFGAAWPLRALLLIAAACMVVIPWSAQDALAFTRLPAGVIMGLHLLICLKAWIDLARTSGSVVAWSHGGWTVDGSPAQLVGHAVLGPLLTLQFETGEVRRDFLICRNVADEDAVRRLRIHLRSVHRTAPAVG